MLPAIKGELKIIGDPTFNNPVFLTGKWVSIVVIDPYYIAGMDAGGAASCEWLSKPNCNSVLSNKRWMILGADHQIQSGSYVTTLNVQLLTPNINIPADSDLGGDGCGTEGADGAIGDEPRDD